MGLRPCPGAVLRLLALLLCSCCSSHAALVVPISTPEQLLDALVAATAPGAPSDSVLELQEDVALTQAAAANYTLPFIIPSNHTLTIRAADGQVKNLDFGGIEGLLYFKAGSTLFFANTNATGAADPQLGSWPEGVESPTVIQTMPLWPSVWADAAFTIDVVNSHYATHPTDLCTPEVFGAQMAALQQLAASAGSNATDLYTNGTVAYFVDWAAPLPVLSPTTKVAIGTVLASGKNTTVSCSKPQPASTAPPPLASNGSSIGSNESSSDGASTSSTGSTPGWVWAVVGVVAALAVAGALAGLLWRRRRLRKQQPQPLEVLKVHDDGDGPSKAASLLAKPPGGPSPGTTAKLASLDRMASNELGSAGSSGIYDQLLQGSRRGAPEGTLRSRVGFIDGLQLGGLIGRGGYARVYKGRWKGTMVAVKVVETHVGEDQCYDLHNEPLLSLSLSHPNILQSYKMCAVRVLSDAENEQAAVRAEGTGNLGSSGGSQGPSISGSGGRVVPHLTNPNCMVEVMPADAVLEPGMYEMWLVSELADKGTLADAMKSGLFKQTEAPGRNLPFILLCLLDAARGLEYLHSCNIMHGDLKPQNVLLKTAGNDRRGFVCKLGDFGLSRMLPETQTHVNTGSYGTVTHASPELLTDGRLTKASDVFAFGILLWELVTGLRLFPDMHHMQIIVQVTQKGYRPPIPADFPPPLADLVRRCWAEDPRARPSAGAIVQELIDFMATFSSTAGWAGITRLGNGVAA